MKTLKLTAILMMALTLSSCKFFRQHKWFSKDIDTMVYTEEEYAEPLADTMAIETIEQETEPIVSPFTEKDVAYGYGSERFYMVVGSFLSEQLAKKYATKIQDLGYSPQIIYSSSLGYYRVSARSYDNFNTAVNDISNFRDNVTPRAWVHVKK
ncbi:MAG: SPOR domain-containing protein [Bacteroidales bacterium]|nr:SPOR domain-containing protein [Bacteroidales bacterium]